MHLQNVTRIVWFDNVTNLRHYILRYSVANSTSLRSVAFHLGDNCIQNFHLGSYIVGFTVRNLVLRRRVNGAVKRDFRTYIRRYTSPNENFENGYPHSYALLIFSIQKDSEYVLCFTYILLHKTAYQLHIFNQWKATLRNDVGSEYFLYFNNSRI